MNVATLLANAARSFADRPAITVGDEVRFSYGQLQVRVARLAAALRGLGLTPGDRVGLAMSNRPQYLEVLHAIWHAGLCAVPVNAKLHPREIAYILDDCGVRLCFVTDDLAGPLAALPQELEALHRLIPVDAPEYERLLAVDPIEQHAAASDDLAWIFYTSGTTGRPKGAMLTHRNLTLMAMSYLSDVDLLSPQDCFFHLGPQSHAAGLLSLPHLAKGGQQVLPASGGFDPDELFDLLACHRSATFFLAPVMLRRFLDLPRIGGVPAEHIRTVICGAAPVYVEDIRRALAALGPCVWNGYGQGECPCTITAMPKYAYAETAHPDHGSRLGSVGIARTGVAVQVVDAEGRPAAPGAIGEVIVRSDIVMRGYWNNPAATADALRGGWLHTGDLGAFDAAGFLTLKDRSKDLIISGGANIYPREIEEVLLTHPDVAEVAVVGLPDREWGERAVAFVVAQAGATVRDEALDRLCLAAIARYKRPREYRFVAALPKNAYGKVLKTALRQAPPQ